MLKRMLSKARVSMTKYNAQLFTAFIICSLVPLLAMGILSYRYTYRNAVERILQVTIRSDDLLNTRLNDRIRQVENVADTLQYDMYSLSQSHGKTSSELNTFNNVRNNISLYKSTFDFFHVFVFLPDDFIGSSEGLTFFPIENFNNYEVSHDSADALTSSDWFYQDNVKVPALAASGTNSEADAIGCARILTDQSTHRTEYAYIIFITTDELSGLMRQAFTDTQIASYIVNEQGTIVAHTDSSCIGHTLPKNFLNMITSQGSEFYNGQVHFHVVQLDNGWYHVTELPKSYIDSNIHVLVISIFILFLITILFVVLLTFVLSHTLTKRLTVLSSAMEAFRLGKPYPESKEKQLVHRGDPKNYDEFDKVGITFLEMKDSINKSMNSIIELSLTQEKLRYKLLQSQINPHFLYNILGTIDNCIILGKLETARKMNESLTRFYRLTLRKSGEMIQIRDELEISELYLELEKLCHNDTLSWEIHTEDGIENYYICKFTLQPFLENSIHYGFAPGIDKIHITIDVSYGDDTVIINIQDNGKGIEKGKLDELQEMLKNGSLSYTKHFGIGNVNRRISSPEYGNGKVQIDNLPNGGASVTIIFDQIDEFVEETS